MFYFREVKTAEDCFLLSYSPCFEKEATQNKQYQIHLSLFYAVD